jgi:hypothetical protein
MFLKRFLKPKFYNNYWTYGPGNIYQIDLFSLSGLMSHIGFEIGKKGTKGPNGPWVLACIDMYSRYLETQYVGDSRAMQIIIKAFAEIIMKMGLPLMVQADEEFNKKEFRELCDKNGIQYFFWKSHENPKNQLIERAIIYGNQGQVQSD